MGGAPGAGGRPAGRSPSEARCRVQDAGRGQGGDVGACPLNTRCRSRPFIFQTDFDRRVTSRRARRKTPGSGDDGQAQVTSTEKSMISNGASRGVRPALLTQSLRARRRVARCWLWDNFGRHYAPSRLARPLRPRSALPHAHLRTVRTGRTPQPRSPPQPARRRQAHRSHADARQLRQGARLQPLRPMQGPLRPLSMR